VIETGLGRRQLREFQLRLCAYSDLALLEDFLKQTRLSTQAILRILRTEKVGSFLALTKLLQAASQANNDGGVDAEDLISLHNMRQRALVYQQTFVSDNTEASLNAQQFITSATFLSVANCLLYERPSSVEQAVKKIFEDMTCEAVDNYTALFEILPLDILNPAVFAPYLPPGQC